MIDPFVKGPPGWRIGLTVAWVFVVVMFWLWWIQWVLGEALP